MSLRRRGGGPLTVRGAWLVLDACGLVRATGYTERIASMYAKRMNVESPWAAPYTVARVTYQWPQKKEASK